MKKALILSLILVGPLIAATPRGRAPSGGGAKPGPSAAAKSTGAAVTSARAGVRGGTVKAAPAPKATGAAAQSAAAPVSSARAAARGGTVKAAPAPKATGGAAPKPGGANSARAAATQSVVAAGAPKINAATSNAGVVSEECKTAYFGCMDSFCMVDNANGARCQCSDTVKTYDTILAEIEKLDAQSLKLATDGVDRIDMGENAAEIDKMVQNAMSGMDKTELMDVSAGSSTANGEYVPPATKKRERRTIDFAAFDTIGVATGDTSEENDLFSRDAALEIEADPLAGLSGNALQTGVRKICVAQVGAGCQKDIQMLQMMYTTQIKADCAGYELELKKRRTASSQKLMTAQRAMKDAALDAFENQNKFDLGQCIVEMRKCISADDKCGSDYTKCTYHNTSQGLAGNSTPATVPGTTIKVAQGTLDSINSKQTLCESTVVKNCVAVKDQVWSATLIEIASSLKSAEVLADSGARQDVLTNISACFQKACASQFDPKAKAADYDACLGDPANMAYMCQDVMAAGGLDIGTDAKDGNSVRQALQCIDAGGKTVSSCTPNSIWNFVVARLGAMRVDACTTAIKEALQAEDACGKGYLGCVSTDSEFIRDVIPPEKLTACAKDGKMPTNADWAEGGKIGNMVMGIFMNIDNTALEHCNNLASKQIAKVCLPADKKPKFDEDGNPIGEDGEAGDAASVDIAEISSGCGALFEEDGSIGKTITLAGTGKGERMKLTGIIDFGNFSVVEPKEPTDGTDGKPAVAAKELDVEKYYRHIEFTPMVGDSAEASNRAAKSVIDTINAKVSALFEGTDGQNLKFCTQGRDLSQVMARAARGRNINIEDRRAGKIETADSFDEKTGMAATSSSKVVKTEARYPRLMDDAIEQILNTGILKAETNYNAQFTEQFKMFNDTLTAKQKDGQGWIDAYRGICWSK